LLLTYGFKRDSAHHGGAVLCIEASSDMPRIQAARWGAAGSEITETALCRDIESHCEAQVRHSWRALHQRISYTTLKYIGHALCTRYLMRQNSGRTFACGSTPTNE
jgi:hypothetical protein